MNIINMVCGCGCAGSAELTLHHIFTSSKIYIPVFFFFILEKKLDLENPRSMVWPKQRVLIICQHNFEHILVPYYAKA